MTQYHLKYLDAAGVAEPIRYIFALAKVDFVNERLPKDELFPKLKPEIKAELPWEQMPVLYENGKLILAQSLAIMRYLAKKFGFAGSNDLEAAKIDEYVYATQDLFFKGREYLIEKDASKKPQILEDMTKESKKFAEKIDNIVKQNGGKWLTGQKISWADIYVVYYMKVMKHIYGIDMKEGLQYTTALWDNFYALPEIKNWLKNNPFKNPTLTDIENGFKDYK